jgi:hypothetical protein
MTLARGRCNIEGDCQAVLDKWVLLSGQRGILQLEMCWEEHRMFCQASRVFIVALLAIAVCLPGESTAQPNHEKSVWNYDGGILLVTDGAVGQGPCFRLSGKVSAPDFFDNLKRVDTNSGTLFRRGHDLVTEFPEQVHLTFVIYDMPCMNSLNQPVTRGYLTRNIMSSLQVGFFWKRGLDVRLATGVVQKHAEVRQVQAYAHEYAGQLPAKYEWWYEFDVPSSGVPVTDSLVIVLRTQDNRFAARVAARM